MALSYHSLKILSQQTMDAARKENPQDARLRKADIHFEDGAYKHAMVHLLTQDNIDVAIEKIMHERGIERGIARTAIISAIETAPPSWQKDTEFLFSKGIAKIGKNYFILPADLRKDSPFDTARQTLSPDAQKILALGLIEVFSKKKLEGDISFGAVTLQYVAAQLMEEGAEKEFRLSALSTGKPAQNHSDHMTNSARAIHIFARETKINLADINVRVQEGRALEKRTVPQKDPSVLPLAFDRQKPVVAVPAALTSQQDYNAGMESLRRDLRRLMLDESIDIKDAQVFFFMSGNAMPTQAEAAEKYGISVEEVSEIMKDVSDILQRASVAAPERLTVRR